MKQNKKTKEKVFCSSVEIEKEYFPKSYKQGIKEEKKEEPRIFGIALAKDLLKNVEKKLK